MKLLAVVIVLIAVAVVAVPQYTNCESGKEQPAQMQMQTSHLHDTPVQVASTGGDEGMDSSGMDSSVVAVPYRMMKCYWAAHAEVVAGVPLFALAVPLFFWRRKMITRTVGSITALMGVLVILVPTALIGTCKNSEMVCNTQMKPTLLISGGLLIALGAAVVVIGELRREDAGSGGAAAA